MNFNFLDMNDLINEISRIAGLQETSEVNKMIAIKALEYVGQKETKNNSGFENKDFSSEMRKIGFYAGAPWCSLFVKLVLKKCEHENYKKINASVLQTMRNLVEFGIDADKIKQVGTLAIWREVKKGKYTTRGHIGIVIDFNEKNFYSIEGNTDSDGDREGDSVLVKKRSYNWTEKNGLRLIGFFDVSSLK